MIRKDEILMGRDAEYPLSDQFLVNLDQLLVAVNALRTLYGKPMYVSSGYRPGKYNVAAGGASNSSHLSCQAVDFRDGDGAIKTFCTPKILEQCGLYMEDPKHTPTWCHVQVRPTANRIFIP